MRRSVDSGSTSECENYTTIRLVTMVEQFFRIMVKEGRLKDYKLLGSFALTRGGL